MALPRPDLWGIVLAGGEGERLRPLTRYITGEDRPKQFCALNGRRTLLAQTLARIAPLVPQVQTVVVASRAHAEYLRRELPGPLPHTLLQPANRGTGPGILWPVHWVSRRDPRAVVAVFPSDHFVHPDAAFLAHVRRAVDLVGRQPDLVVLLGIEPDRPEESYGWIEPGDPVPGAPDCFRVLGFWEKPTAARALIFLDSGFLWNTLVVVARAETLKALGRRCLPDIDARLSGIDAAAAGEGAEEAMQQAFASMRSANFSDEVLARGVESLVVLPVRGVLWSDLGTPERVVQTLRRIHASPGWLEGWSPAAAWRTAG